jgi:DNA adenine methylase
MSAPLKYHGGKTYLANEIIRRFPKHKHYVEPYFGGGAVLFAKPDKWIEGYSEVVNDIYSELMTFWKVLKFSTTFESFVRKIQATPFSQSEWTHSAGVFSDDPVDLAVAMFVRFRQSRQGLGDSFATMSRSRTRRGMNEQIASWLTAIDGLPEAHMRLRRVVMFHEDAIKIIRQEDSPDTFFYLDPPYLQSTRKTKKSYRFEMTEDQHKELLGALSRVRGKFLLSGYNSTLYELARIGYKWFRHDIVIDNKASGAKTKSKVTECLWANYSLDEAMEANA